MRISDWSSDVCSSDLRPWRRGLLIGVPLAILAWGGYSITHRGSPALAAPPPPTVTIAAPLERAIDRWDRSEEHTSELQSLMRISYAVFCLKKKKQNNTHSTFCKYERYSITCDTVRKHN